MNRPGTPSSTEQDEQRSALLARLLAEEGLDDAAEGASIGRRAVRESAPLSFAQEVLWLLDRASPGQTAYNTPIARRIRGPLDVPALQRALNALVARHESMRTVFAQRGDSGTQVVLDDAPVSLELVDLRSEPESTREANALLRLRAIADTPFDLAAQPPFRAALARIADDDAVLLLLTHHIASDAWSYGIMFRDLGALYDQALSGREPAIPAAELQFGDYTTWQRLYLQGDELAHRLAYWRERLAQLPVLELPTARPASGARGFGGARGSMMLSPQLTADVKRLARERGVTLYMVLLAAYQTVLHRYSGQDDIVVGSAVAGRTHRETEEMVGYFSQALPMRTRFDGDPTVAELLARVADTVLGAFEHQDVPLEALVLELQRDQPGSAALFRAVLTMQDAILTELRLGDATISPVELDASSTKFDLTMLVSDRADGIELSLWYRTELFDAPAIERLLGHFRNVLESFVRDAAQRISALEFLDAEEVAALRALESGASHRGERQSLASTIQQHALHAPQWIALVDESGSTTYGELVHRATQLAHQMISVGVNDDAPIGIALDRSADAIVAMLGAWLAGSAYVPLVPTLPEARLAQQASESGVTLVVTRDAHRERLPAKLAVISLDGDAETLGAASQAPIATNPTVDALAYVLFTSGSTGVPKGVAVTHGNVAHYTAAIVSRLGLEMSEAPLHFATVSTLGADLGLTAVLAALATGGTLHILSHDVTTDATRFAEYLAQHPIDVLKITPRHLQALTAGRTGASLKAVLPRRWLVLGGEALPLPLANALVAAGGPRVLNHYGPTETTVGATTFEVTAAWTTQAHASGTRTAPIGRPLEGVQVCVLDTNGRRVPVGVTGELHIGGAGVARGYLNQPERTAERFVSEAHLAGQPRCYRTGDQVRWLEAGELEFLGRADDQVKVRGYRVELAEIEQVLRGHPAVGEVAVLLNTPADESDDPVLVAYLAARATSGYAVAHAERLTAETATRFASERLPDYMVPSAIVLLDALPLNANGKLDRAALPAYNAAAPAAASHVAPRTATEASVATIWGEVFKRDQIGVTDQFLQLGGHSLLAIRILGKLTRTFGVRLPLRTLFDAPTVEQLALIIDKAKAATS